MYPPTRLDGVGSIYQRLSPSLAVCWSARRRGSLRSVLTLDETPMRSLKRVDQVSEPPSNKKTARRRSLHSRSDIVQAKRNFGLLFRRYAMKPIPKKPMIIIAQVDDSGTAATLMSSRPKKPPSFRNPPNVNVSWPVPITVKLKRV
jgi:hypothetical protein